MQVEPEIVFRNVESTPPVERLILQGLRQLEQVHPHIMACRIMVELPNPRRRRGNLYRVRLDVTVPGHEVVVNRNPPEHRTHEELTAATREAFSLARDRLRRQRERDAGQVKTHDVPPHGRVVSLDGAEGFGYIASSDGREVYFHRTGVPHDGFDGLDVGTEVRFIEEEVAGSPRAVSVTRIGHHHPSP
jgi:cold shock CspA family protein/ribosome-associated translation inhibitor RaiA